MILINAMTLSNFSVYLILSDDSEFSFRHLVKLVKCDINHRSVNFIRYLKIKFKFLM